MPVLVLSCYRGFFVPTGDSLARVIQPGSSFDGFAELSVDDLLDWDMASFPCAYDKLGSSRTRMRSSVCTSCICSTLNSIVSSIPKLHVNDSTK